MQLFIQPPEKDREDDGRKARREEGKQRGG